MPVPNDVMDPTVSSGTINPTVPMTLQHFPYPPPISYIGPQGATPLLACSPFLYMFCLPSSHSETRDSLIQSAPSSVTSTTVTPSQSHSANQPICSTCGCTGHPHTVPISNPRLSAMHAIPPTQFHLDPDISTTSNGRIPTHVHNGAHQYVNSIAQPIPAGEPSVHGYIYGYNQLLNSQQNANHNAERRPKKISCYNCGSSKHLGTECTKPTMDEMIDTLHMIYRITEPDSESDSESDSE